MKRTAIPNTGVYQDATGGFWARPTLDGRKRTWRRLKALTVKKAIQEAAGADFKATADTFARLAQFWVESGCPGKKAGPARPDACREMRVQMLVDYFGKFRADEIRQKHIMPYADWRRKKLTRKVGGWRTIELDMVTLSNILRFGVHQGHLEFNYLKSDRPSFGHVRRHAREVMPENAEAIHRIAGELLSSVRSEVFGWLCFFSPMSGCRRSELLRLKRNAKNKNEPGFIEWLSEEELAERKKVDDDCVGHLYLGRRSKNGLFPWIRIGPEFAEMLKAFDNWHRQRFKNRSEWYFPGRFKEEVIDKDSFGTALTRIIKILNGSAKEKIGHITTHGFRAYYATKRLRDGIRPVDIAAEMGDRTVALIEGIYADNSGGRKLWWTPADGLPAWTSWLKPQTNGLNLDSSHAVKK